MNNIKTMIIFLTLFPFLEACDTDEFLDGFNRQELFSEPTQAELDTVLMDWASRDLSPNGYAVEEETPIGTVGTVLKIVSFEVDGFKEYGALIIPETTTPLPVRMSIYGFSLETTTNLFNLNLNDDNGLPFIFAIPALRGQSLSLTINGNVYTSPKSEGRHCDAFDSATNDAIAFLNIIENTEINANTDRVAVTGGSRGGTVALLMGERDERVKRIVGIVSPTNMLELASQNENDSEYQCQFLQELINGDITITEARHKMIASSPIYFAQNLPLSQLHMGEDDIFVPKSQGEKLLNKMTSLGLDENFELFIYENRTHSNIGMENQEMSTRIQQFLSEL